MRTMIAGFQGWVNPRGSSRETCATVDAALVVVLGCWIVVTWLLMA